MEDAMVTGRMSPDKKAAGAKVLAREGLNASQAINLLYDKLIEEQNAEFIAHRQPDQKEWKAAAKFLESLASPFPVETRFDTMTRGEIKLERAKARGLI